MQQLKRLLLQGPAGGISVSDPKLAYASVITVKRNGSRNYPVSSLPSGSDPNFYFDSSSGKITFSSDLPFNFSNLNPDGSRVIEFIHIIYTGGGGILVDTPPILTP